MEQNTKHLLIAGIAVVVVIALAIILPHLKHAPAAPVTDPATVSAVADTASPAPSTASSRQAAWDAIVTKYKNSAVVFSADCTASPVTQTLAKGTTVLLVNDSDVAHTIMVGTASYAVGARHYKTSMLNEGGVAVINCDAQQNVANIAVQ
jgi:hypothetical protein